MYRNIMESIENIQIWPLIGLVIFFIFFTGVLIRVLRTDKTFTDRMKNMPLDDNDHPNETKN